MPEYQVKKYNLLPDHLAQQVEQIYQASFPPGVRKPFAEIVSALATGDEVLYIAVREHQVLGFAVLALLAARSVLFLDTMAVSETARDQGVGSQIFQDILLKAQTDRRITGMILEVEPPETAGEEADVLLRERRIEFYRRNGAELVAGSQVYRIPEISGAGSVPMQLMWMPLNSADGVLSPRKLRQLIILIFAQVYERTREDALLQSILENLPG